MNKIAAFLALLIPLFQASCETEQIEVSPVEGYFQFEYINYAWGYNHSGFTVTPAGEILSFDKTTPWAFAENGVIIFDSLKKNLDASVKIDTLIGQGELEFYKKLAADAVSGKLSEPLQVGADMGEVICKIIVPNQKSLLYFEIILTQTGDFERHNLESNAGVIAAWLRKLNDELF